MVMAKEIGRYLTTLREDIGLKQNELAERVSLNPAVLSRIESGERPPSTEELQTLLDAIGTDDACRWKQNVHREWRKLDRPALGHPHEDLLWDAEEALLDIDALRDNPEITGVFNNRLNEYEAEIRSADGRHSQIGADCRIRWRYGSWEDYGPLPGSGSRGSEGR